MGGKKMARIALGGGGLGGKAVGSAIRALEGIAGLDGQYALPLDTGHKPAFSLCIRRGCHGGNRCRGSCRGTAFRVTGINQCLCGPAHGFAGIENHLIEDV